MTTGLPATSSASAADATVELATLRAKLAEAEQTLDAIRNGEVDAVVVGGAGGQIVYTLENADRPYRVLIEQMQEGAVTLADDGTILYCNQRFATLVDWPRETILGQGVGQLFAEDDADVFIGLLADSQRVTSATEFLLRSLDGHLVPVNISLVDLTVETDASRVICGVVTDLTQNRRRAEELAAANARLADEFDERRRVEDSLRLALEAADMGDWEVDLVNGTARRSLRYDQIFGLPAAHPEWTLDHALERFIPEDRDAVARAFADAERTGIFEYERRIRRGSDNAVRWLNARGRTYYEAGRAVRIAGVVSDVTDRRAIEEQLRQSQKMEAVGQLTGGIAHDFNNLLLVIGGSLELLGRRLPVDDRTTRLLEAAKSGVARGAKLNHQLLAFSRRQDLQAEVVSIDDLIPTFEHLLDRAVGEAVKIDVRRAPGIWSCTTDPLQLQTAILNLAINARDAMPDGGTLTLTMENCVIGARASLEAGAAAGDYVVVSVHDTGIGIEPDVLAHVFEPFFTTKEIGKGTGLGLSQVYGFARQSEGFVTIASAPAQGTTVLIHLPRSHLPRSSSAAVKSALPAAEPGRGVVLLVEDDGDVRATASAMLRDLGYTVREAGNAHDALAVIDAGEPIDLIFSDVIMPDGMSGIELVRELGKRPVSPRVLLTSGYTAQRIIPDELAGQLRLLRKPYTQPALSQAIREAMRVSASGDPPGRLPSGSARTA